MKSNINSKASRISCLDTDSRPMTATRAAGYQRDTQGTIIRSDEEISCISAKTNSSDLSSEMTMGEMESMVFRLIDKAASKVAANNYMEALQVANEARTKERACVSFLESKSMPLDELEDAISATWFNLASVYEKNNMLDEAIQSYSFLAKQIRFKSWLGRLRVNMGNIYYKRRMYDEAITMYQMASDLFSPDDRITIQRVYMSIGNAYYKQRRYREAIRYFEQSAKSSQNINAYFNLLLSYYRVGYSDKVKRTFIKMVSVASKTEGLVTNSAKLPYDFSSKDSIKHVEDCLSTYLELKMKKVMDVIFMASQMVISLPHEAVSPDSSQWVRNQLKEYFPQIAAKIEMNESIENIRIHRFDIAVKRLKSFEKRDSTFTSIAAVNLSYVYFLDGNYIASNEFANIALQHNKYNPNALVNKGNVLFFQGLIESAKELYLEALYVNSTFPEAMYNLGLANIRLGLEDDALDAFEKLHNVAPNDPQVLYQVATLFHRKGNVKSAIEWFNVLYARIPSDPGVLGKLGKLYETCGEESQSLSFILESFRCYPSCLDVIAWLGMFFFSKGLYARSISFVHRVASMQPDEAKWHLMLGDCYDRLGLAEKSLEIYRLMAETHPENTDCLQRIVSLCKDTNRTSSTYAEYQNTLNQLIAYPVVLN